MKENHITQDMSVDKIMRFWPQTVTVFLANGMQCVGCPLAIFHTTSEAAREHNIAEEYLVRQLNKAIELE